jgi:hypothetical protein
MCSALVAIFHKIWLASQQFKQFLLEFLQNNNVYVGYNLISCQCLHVSFQTLKFVIYVFWQLSFGNIARNY